MKTSGNKNKKPKTPNYVYKTIEIALIICWLTTIQASDSLYIPYLAAGIGSVLCCFNRSHFGRHEHWLLSFVFAFILTFFVCSANYAIFPPLDVNTLPSTILTYLSLTIGSFLVFYNIFIYLPTLIAKIPLTKSKSTKFSRLKPRTIFLISFAIITVTYLLVLFLSKYPGNLSVDSIHQITQNLDGEYNNHHPFTHTILIGFFLNLGQNLFNDLNIGVTLYSIFQILFMASIFAYSLVTLHQKNCSKAIIITILLFYVLCPYHIMYSMTMWKDVIFAGFVLLFIVSQYRIFHHLGKNWPNYLFLSLSSLGICLFRSNGIYVMIALLILFIILHHRQFLHSKKLLANSFIVVFAILSSFIYNKAILPSLNVAPAESVEALSLPIQQVARTTRDHTLNSDQLALLDHVIDVNQINETYRPWISDPVKKQIWERSDQGAYFNEHKLEFLKLYFDLGFTHPASYFYAWVDLTRGYYNGGYIYWVLFNDVQPNDFNINQSRRHSIPDKIFDTYLSAFENNPILRLIYCIGFAVWSAVALLFISITKKDKISILLISLPLLIIATLLLATPVFAEFRYAYSLFCCLPFLAVITLLPTLRQQNLK